MIESLCLCTGLPYATLSQRTRHQEIVLARQLVMAKLVEMGYSLSRAGKLFGLSHCTVIHAKAVVSNLEHLGLIGHPTWMVKMHREFNTNYSLLFADQQDSFDIFITDTLIENL